jgi:hypothetical protein
MTVVSDTCRSLVSSYVSSVMGASWCRSLVRRGHELLLILLADDATDSLYGPAIRPSAARLGRYRSHFSSRSG